MPQQSPHVLLDKYLVYSSKAEEMRWPLDFKQIAGLQLPGYITEISNAINVTGFPPEKFLVEVEPKQGVGVEDEELIVWHDRICEQFYYLLCDPCVGEAGAIAARLQDFFRGNQNERFCH